MINEMKTFSEFSKDAQAACVLMYNMSLGHSEKPASVLPTVKNSPKVAKKYYGPKPRWTQDDRIELFSLFESGNRDWASLGKRFGRSSSAVASQYYDEYLSFINKGA